MPIYNWEDFLTNWSEEFFTINTDQFILQQLSAQARDTQWLGFSGATTSEIDEAERRLGRRLPTSYSEFLSFTNGWVYPTNFIRKIWSSAQIEWYPVRHRRDTIEPWIRGAGGIDEVGDEDYLIYGSAQASYNIRINYLETALEISEQYNGAVYLLNPQTISDSGEWEAWFFASWLNGANRYRSFWDLMQAQHELFLRLQKR